MRVVILVKGNKDSEAGKLPSSKLLTAMMNFNEELVKAGIMLAGEGLKDSSHGKRIRFSGNQRTVIDGPFTETKEIVAGFWIWQVKSMDEAVEWLKRMPQEEGGEVNDVEIRPVFEMDDFSEVITPETRAKEAELRRLTANTP